MQLEVEQKKLGKFAKGRQESFHVRRSLLAQRRYSLSLEREGRREGGGIAHP